MQVIGVADAPTLNVSTVNGTEDQPIPLGAAISASLNDTDGSEVLYYVISGLPAGVVPSVGVFIGGEWQLTAAQLPSLTIPAPPNFSGNYTTTFAPGLTVRAVAQEDDGNQTSVSAPLNVVVAPHGRLPGLEPLGAGPEDNDIPLASAAFSGLPDGDGSEQIVSYTFNLNGIIAAAQIGGVVPDVNTLIASHVTGTFTNNGDGTITVLAANLRRRACARRPSSTQTSTSRSPSPRASRKRRAVPERQRQLRGQPRRRRRHPDRLRRQRHGGHRPADRHQPDRRGIRRRDHRQRRGTRRANSERIYYIVSGPAGVLGTDIAFFRPGGQLAGLNNNDGTWYLTPADLVDLQISSGYGYTGSVTLTLTSVTVENDGDLATAATPASFTATFTPDPMGSGGGITPLTPTISITPITTAEDGNVQFSVTVSPAPGDPSPTTPTVSLFISNLPAGAQITGATLNPNTGRYNATKDDLDSGAVRIIPPPNYSARCRSRSRLWR